MHPLGGLTREEALQVYDFARMAGSASPAEAKAVEEIGRRASYELRQLYRAEDYPGVLKFVKSSEGFGHAPEPEELAFTLESILDQLDRGDTETLENFAEWRKRRRWAK